MRTGQPVVGSHIDLVTNWRTLDGKYIKVRGGDLVGQMRLAGPGTAGRLGEEWEWRWRGELPWWDRIWRAGGGRTAERWYFVHDGKLDGHAYFVGYDDETKQRIGYIARDGLQPDQPRPDEQFPVDGRDVVRGNPLYSLASGDSCLLADHRLIRINLKNRTVTVLREDANLVSVAIVHDEQRAPDSLEVLTSQFTIFLRTPDRVIVLKPDGKEIGTYPIPLELRKDAFTWYQLPDNASLIEFSGGGKAKLFWIDAAGKIDRQELVELEHQSALARWWRIEENLSLCLSVPSPGAVAIAYFCRIWGVGRCLQWQDYWAATKEVFDRLWPFFLSSSIVSIVLAVLCYRRQRKYGLPWTPVWTIFVLLFGLPAYFGYLAHRVWPGRAACPNCGQLVPRDRPACFACGQEFPAPAIKGTEVFA